jgi:hypothetical protein
MNAPDRDADGLRDAASPRPAADTQWPLPARRVVLLGASNLTRGLALAVETAQLCWGAPLDVCAAAGHGRSYGLVSRVLMRTLPSILNCGLWEDLARRPPVPTAGLLTDIGNDLLYGASVPCIVEWLDECLSRLTPHCTRLVVTALPLERLQTLTARQFQLLRAALFPSSRLQWPEALVAAEQLNRELVTLATRYDARLVTPRAAWYGWDPIHVRSSQWAIAWHEILAGWCAVAPTQVARGSWRRWWTLCRQRPQSRHWCGVHQQRAQPTCVLRDGTALSLY